MVPVLYDNGTPVTLPGTAPSTCPAGTVVDIASGPSNVCTIVQTKPGAPVSNVICCWGESNQIIKLGATAVASQTVVHAPGLLMDRLPVLTAGTSWKQITVGGNKNKNKDRKQAHACVLDTAGNAYCWGKSKGRLGFSAGKMSYESTPGRALPGKIIKAVAAGGKHTLFLLADGSLIGAGANKKKQLGIGANTDNLGDQTTVPWPASHGRVVAIAAGYNFSCALSVSIRPFVRCWGANDMGQLGLEANVPPFSGMLNEVKGLPK